MDKSYQTIENLQRPLHVTIGVRHDKEGQVNKKIA